MSSRLAGAHPPSASPLVSDNRHYVGFDIPALIAGVFYTIILLLVAVLERTLTLLQPS